MGLFSFQRGPRIDEGVQEYRAAANGVLLDVRTPQEYREGHIPGSRNIPLQCLDQVAELVPDRSAPIYVYCRSGSRSGQAAAILKGMGYAAVQNIGGILSYTGDLEY